MEIVKGNVVDALLRGEVDVLIHQANCFHTFGSGIAKEIRERVYEAYKADLTTEYASRDKLGTFSVAFKDAKPYVINLYGQYNYGRDKRYTDYEALWTGLDSIAKCLPEGTRVGLPLLGCGSAGGDWNIVKKIVEKCLRDFEVKVYKM